MQRVLSEKEKSDIATLARFVAIFCREKHQGVKTPFRFDAAISLVAKGDLDLCADCAKLLKYGLTMRLRCPHDPKPMCKKCAKPCYRPEYREGVREVMKFSGMYLVKRGRLDLLYHYLK
jgi:hypothetical protein